MEFGNEYDSEEDKGSSEEDDNSTKAALHKFNKHYDSNEDDTELSEEGLRAIALSEGYKSNVYSCKRKAPTVGYGQNLKQPFN